MFQLRKLHKTLALSIAAFIFILATSGIGLVFQAEIVSWALGATTTKFQVSSTEKETKALKKLVSKNVSFILFPSHEKNYYSVRTQSGDQSYYAPDNLQHLEPRFNIPQIFTLLHNIHTSLNAKKAGANLVALVAVVFITLLVMGAVIWFPARKGFSLKHAIPGNTSLGAVNRSHRSLGIILLPILLTSAVTGACMLLLDFSIPNHTSNHPSPSQVDWKQILLKVHNHFPEGQITRIKPGNPIVVRLHQPNDVMSYGSSYIYIDAKTTDIIDAFNLTNEGIYQKTKTYLYPIHSGSIGGAPYRFIVFLSGLGLVLLAYTGTASWLLKKRRKK